MYFLRDVAKTDERYNMGTLCNLYDLMRFREPAVTRGLEIKSRVPYFIRGHRLAFMRISFTQYSSS